MKNKQKKKLNRAAQREMIKLDYKVHRVVYVKNHPENKEKDVSPEVEESVKRAGS